MKIAQAGYIEKKDKHAEQMRQRGGKNGSRGEQFHRKDNFCNQVGVLDQYSGRTGNTVGEYEPGEKSRKKIDSKAGSSGFSGFYLHPDDDGKKEYIDSDIGKGRNQSP